MVLVGVLLKFVLRKVEKTTIGSIVAKGTSAYTTVENIGLSLQKSNKVLALDHEG